MAFGFWFIVFIRATPLQGFARVEIFIESAG